MSNSFLWTQYTIMKGENCGMMYRLSFPLFDKHQPVHPIDQQLKFLQHGVASQQGHGEDRPSVFEALDSM
jgi:hypothetical protein